MRVVMSPWSLLTLCSTLHTGKHSKNCHLLGTSYKWKCSFHLGIFQIGSGPPPPPKKKKKKDFLGHFFIGYFPLKLLGHFWKKEVEKWKTASDKSFEMGFLIPGNIGISLPWPSTPNVTHWVAVGKDNFVVFELWTPGRLLPVRARASDYVLVITWHCSEMKVAGIGEYSKFFRGVLNHEQAKATASVIPHSIFFFYSNFNKFVVLNWSLWLIWYSRGKSGGDHISL